MPATPAEVFTELIQRINEARWTDLADLYTEDTLVEHPLLGTHVNGRKALADRFARLGNTSMKAFDVTVHETTDPEVVVAEYSYEEPTFTAANVQVVRVRDGLITHSRDYHDHVRMAAARGDFSGIPATYAPSPSLPTPPVPEPGTPVAVVYALLASISSPIPESRADLYADDAYVTHPFFPGAPPLTNKDELRQHFAPGRGRGLRPRNIVFHEGKDPELVIAEFEFTGKAPTGKPLVARNIFVTRVRNGLIVESRDYADHVALAVANDLLPDLLAAAKSVVKQARP
jgi:ketosteroid isomerase-like protein